MTLLLVVAQAAEAAPVGTTLYLAPHCAAQDRRTCRTFDVQDASNLMTDPLSIGDILDLDVVLETRTPASVETVKSWLRFDPTVLEARSVELTSALPAPFPGEQSMDAAAGIVKIGGTTNGLLSTQATAIARVTFRVKSEQGDARISFNDYRTDGLGNTAVNTKRSGQAHGGIEIPCVDKFVGCRGTATPLLIAEPSALILVMNDSSHPAATSSSTVPVNAALAAQETVPDDVIQAMRNRNIHANQAIASSTSAQSTTASQTEVSRAATAQARSAPATGASSFALLQVQKPSVTTRERDVYLGWMALRSAEIKGYNIYYGTVSGRYLQRKTVPATSTSIVIRDLEPGSTYFLAVRGLSNSDAESAFSQEVSIVVGQPTTSTSPITEPIANNDDTAHVDELPRGKNIAGDTGMPEYAALFALLCAGVGTTIAARRQFILSSRYL